MSLSVSLSQTLSPSHTHTHTRTQTQSYYFSFWVSRVGPCRAVFLSQLTASVLGQITSEHWASYSHLLRADSLVSLSLSYTYTHTHTSLRCELLLCPTSQNTEKKTEVRSKNRAWKNKAGGCSFKFYIPNKHSYTLRTYKILYVSDMELIVPFTLSVLRVYRLQQHHTQTHKHTHTYWFTAPQEQTQGNECTHHSWFYETFVSAGPPCVQHQSRGGQ